MCIGTVNITKITTWKGYLDRMSHAAVLAKNTQHQTLEVVVGTTHVRQIFTTHQPTNKRIKTQNLYTQATAEHFKRQNRPTRQDGTHPANIQKDDDYSITPTPHRPERSATGQPTNQMTQTHTHPRAHTNTHTHHGASVVHDRNVVEVSGAGDKG